MPAVPDVSAVRTAGADPSVALEQLCWLASMCGHVLADLGDGETPLVPLPILRACETAAATEAGGGAGAAADPAERLSAALLAVGGHYYRLYTQQFRHERVEPIDQIARLFEDDEPGEDEEAAAEQGVQAKARTNGKVKQAELVGAD